jgi:transposase
MPSRDEILTVYQAGPEAMVAWVQQLFDTYQRQTVELLAAHELQLADVTARVAQLESSLKQDSHNSHQPPSSDGLAKKPHPRSLRRRSGKKSGGQAGHPGVTRLLVDDPEVIVVHAPRVCCGCGTSLALATTVDQDRRQVIEIPVPHPVVTEHQALHQVCAVCHRVTVGTFPPEITQPVQYGPRLKAVMVYLQVHQLLSFERLVEALRELFGVEPSEGTLSSAQALAYTRLAPVAQAIHGALRQAAVANVDETGIRVAGRTEWVHVFSTERLTFYAHHAKRGLDAFKAIGLLVGFLGRRVHDSWAPYLSLPGLYALCNAHLLRELIGRSEDTQQAWLQALIRLLLNMQTTVITAKAAGQTELPPRQLAGYEAAYTRLLHDGLRANPPSPPTGKAGHRKQTRTRNLLDRLVAHRVAVLAFLHDFQVPFDNNQAERDLRMLKVKLKVSGCFRSPAGADQFCRIRGYISTLRKQGYSVLDGLTSVFTGEPFMPELNA